MRSSCSRGRAGFPLAVTRRRKREFCGCFRAFTLLEVLIVVGILTILAALLLPVVNTVRKKAVDAGCISHLRTLGMAYNAYRMEHKGNGPPHIVGETTSQYFSFDEGHSYGAFHTLRYYYREGPPYVWGPHWIIEPIEYCPAARLTGLAGNPKPTPHDSHYKMIPGVWSNGELGQALLNGVTTPSKMPIIWDAWGGGYGGETLPLRHNNGINAAFLDGHVGHISQSLSDGRLYRDWWINATTYRDPKDSRLGKGEAMGRSTKE